MRKCITCGREALVHLPYARAYYCDEDFLKYLCKKVEKTIKKYKLISGSDHILVAISGGKDSIALADILANLRGDLGFKMHLLHINLGIDKYSEDSVKVCEAIATKLEVPLTIIPLPEILDLTIPEISEVIGREACSVCGIVKRYLTNLSAYYWGGTKLATGHTLNDLATFALKNILVGDFQNLYKLQPETETFKTLISRIRPLAETYDEEAKLYVIFKKLPHVKEECPLSPRNSLEREVRRFLVEIEYKHPSLTLGFYRSILRSFIRTFRGVEYGLTDFMTCEVCKMPSSSKICGFCKLILNSGKNENSIIGLHKYIKRLKVDYN